MTNQLKQQTKQLIMESPTQTTQATQTQARELLEQLGIEPIQVEKLLKGEEINMPLAVDVIMNKVGASLKEDSSFMGPIEKDISIRAEKDLTKRFASALNLSVDQQAKSIGDPDMVIKYYQQNAETGDKEVDGLQRTINELNQQLLTLENEKIPQLKLQAERELKEKDIKYSILGSLQKVGVPDEKIEEAYEFIEFKSSKNGFRFDLREGKDLKIIDSENRPLRDKQGLRERQVGDVLLELMQSTDYIVEGAKQNVPEKIEAGQNGEVPLEANQTSTGYQVPRTNSINVATSMQGRTSRNIGPTEAQIARNKAIMAEMADTVQSRTK